MPDARAPDPLRHAPVEHHPPIEEYLQTIESLTEEGTSVIQARIAERLGKTPPSVSEMLDRLAGEGYVERRGRRIMLTAQGHALAQSVIRKHRLAERLLVDVIGLPWHLVHEEAGRWEHVMSDAVEARLVQLLDDPGTCPHGNPIPGSAHLVTDDGGQRALVEMAEGAHIRFARLTEELELDGDSLRYLGEAGFVPGRAATVRARSSDGTIVIDLGDRSLALGRDLCKKMFVVEVDSSG